MATLVIDVSEFTALGQRFANAGPIVAREMKTAMQRSTADSARRASAGAGRYRALAPIHYDERDAGAGPRGNNLVYGPAIEFGEAGQCDPAIRGARLDGSAWHPRQRRVPGPAQDFPQRHDPQPYLVPAFERNKDAIEREFALAADRALRALAA
jgi:hypothetical protein